MKENKESQNKNDYFIERHLNILLTIIFIGILLGLVSLSWADPSAGDVTVVEVSENEFNFQLSKYRLDSNTYQIAQTLPSVTGGSTATGSATAFAQKEDLSPQQRTMFTGENRLILYYDSIKGAKERSFITPGKNYLEELDLNLTHQFENDIRFEGALGARMTDDESVDTERASIQRFYLKLTGITFEATLGDTIGNFTEYTLMQNIRGFMGFKDFAILEGTRITLIAGIIKNRWEGLWKTVEEETYDRYIEGVRVEQRITDTLTLNLNAVSFKDDPATIHKTSQGETITGTETGTETTARLQQETTTDTASTGTTPNETTSAPYYSTTLPPLRNYVGSIEIFFRPSRDFRVDGEAATSWLDTDIKSSEVVKMSDQAYRLDTRLRLGPVRVGGGYNRIEPDYYSAGVFATPDLEEYYGKVEIDIAEPFMIGASYRNSWDNVKHQKEIRTKILKQEGFFLFTGIKGFSLEGRYKELKTTASDGLEDKKTKTASGNLSYQLGPARLSLGYEDRRKEDDIDPGREGKGYLATSRLDLQFDGENVKFAPYVGYDREVDKTVATTARPETKTVQQTTYGGLTFEIISMAALELSYRLWDTDTTEAGLDAIRTEAKAELRYYLFGNSSRYLALSFIERDYEFEKIADTSTSASSSSNGYIPVYASDLGYTERRFECRFVYRF